MSYRLLWTTQASNQLEAIYNFIADDNPSAALKEACTLVDALETLTATPHIGRSGRIAGTRELVIAGTPYIAAYRLSQNRLEVLGIYHGAQRWPQNFR